MWSIVVAGGAGLRFGTRKQFAALKGMSIVQRSVTTASAVSDGVVVVVPADAIDTHGTTGVADIELRVMAGGATRAQSVRCGLDAVPDECDIILVHDAARPLASTQLFEAVIDAVEAGAAAVVPGLPVADSLRRIDGGAVDRETMVAVQTPQGFDAATLRSAHAGGEDATDDASLAEQIGAHVVIVPGEAENRRITDPVDLIAAEAIVHGSEA